MRNAPHKNKPAATDSHETEFTIVTMVEDMDQANNYRLLLEENDIDVVIDEPYVSGDASIAVKVPEEYLDEALVIIESHDAYDDFIDLTLEDDNFSGFDGMIDDEY